MGGAVAVVFYAPVGGCMAFCGRFAAVGVVLYRVRACGGSVGVVERWSVGRKKSPGSYTGAKEKPPGRAALFYLFCFNTSLNTANGKIKIQSKINSFHPLISR